jgi:hypothetical protein
VMDSAKAQGMQGERGRDEAGGKAPLRGEGPRGPRVSDAPSHARTTQGEQSVRAPSEGTRPLEKKSMAPVSPLRGPASVRGTMSRYRLRLSLLLLRY